MKDGLLLLGAATPRVHLADPAANAREIADAVREAADAGVRVLALPELALTGYSCGDLFLTDTLVAAAREALLTLARETAQAPLLFFVGVPLQYGGRLYNCAAAVSGGRVLGIVPKTAIPNYAEFYEARHFAPAPAGIGTIALGGENVPFGTRLLFSCREMPSLVAAAEICEDLWIPAPPSVGHAMAGATVIVNLSASSETVGKEEYRRMLVASQSGRLLCAYVYADCGAGESTTDLVFAGHRLIGEGGTIAAEDAPFSPRRLTTATVDLAHLTADRRRMTTFGPAGADAFVVPFSLPLAETPLTRPVDAHPFLPPEGAARADRCRRILALQCAGLAQRLTAAHADGAVVAVSGGLDSCLALLVAARTAAQLGWESTRVTAVTLPCFGTTRRTKSNAEILSRELGADFSTIDIAEAVSVHFRDIALDPSDRSVTYENAQARERTQIAMDLANKKNALVVGTGDLSELALGWATFNGDHMSNYGVNAGIPKTLVRHVVAYCADEAQAEGRPALAAVLRDILATPVSPELLPAKDGEIAQKTEDLVGPYELHDFFLYRFLRWGETQEKLRRMARAAFAGVYGDEVIERWLRVFLRRFFAQQFKRSCLPDGPKIGTVGLSPRGDWRMPSDAAAAAWLEGLR